MDYRMYSGTVPAGKNVVTLIKDSLKEQGIMINTPLKFIGFECANTTFKLNGHKESIAAPSNGYFITPYAGDRFMPIYNLVFDEDFYGTIYYII